MIKYLGSKRRLIPVLTELFQLSGARTALDLFTGTTRVAQAFKLHGGEVTAVDTARYSEVFGRTWIETDADSFDHAALTEALAELNALPGTPGYVTDTFCVQSRFIQPHNGDRIDAIRDVIASDYAGTALEPVLLTQGDQHPLGDGQLPVGAAYDLVLVVPLVGQLVDPRADVYDSGDGSIPLNLALYIAVIAYSGALAVYHLFVSRATRLGIRARPG